MSNTTDMRCLIIDDEAPARAVIRKYLSDIPGYEIVAECKNAFEANEAIHSKYPDLIFLDINMPKLTGLKLLEGLQNPPLAIITTAYREYALESFELDVVDYLHKPFSLERFIKALNKARKRKNTKPAQTVTEHSNKIEDDFIFLKEEGRVIRIDLRDVIFLESVGDYLAVETRASKHLSYMTMKKMINLLPPQRFARIHKSFIVNIAKITSIDGNRVYLGERSFPIGSTYRGPFMDMIKSHMG